MADILTTSPRSKTSPRTKTNYSPRTKTTSSSRAKPVNVVSPRGPPQPKTAVEATKQVAKEKATEPSVSREEARMQRMMGGSSSSVDRSSQVDAGLGSNDEAEKREAARFAKMMGASGAAPKPKRKAAEADSKMYPLPLTPQKDSAYERQLWIEINAVRANPKNLLSHLEKNADTYGSPVAVKEAVKFLQNQPALSASKPLKMADGLSSSCVDLCRKQSRLTNPTESADAAKDRLQKYGKFQGRVLQNVAFGNLAPKDVICAWIVDEKSSEKPHRQALFDAAMCVVGIASAPHVQAKRVITAAFAEGYMSKEEHAAKQKKRRKNYSGNHKVVRNSSR